MDRNAKLLFALAALAGGTVGVVVAFNADSPALGTAALAAFGAFGWFYREFDREESERRRVCQAYASVIAIQYEFTRDILGDDQLDQWLALAPRIARGLEPESFGEGPDDPYPLLPDLKPHLHLLASGTVDLLGRWHYLDADMVSIWEDLGTKRLSSLGTKRLSAYFDRIKNHYRADYRDYGYSALLALENEMRGKLIVNKQMFVDDGAKDRRAAT